MPWFRHHYHCEACRGSWLAEGELIVEADCPFCATRDVFPYKSDDRSVAIEQHQKLFVVLEAMQRPARGKRKASAPGGKRPARVRKAG